MNPIVILALIAALQKEVILLETELLEQQAVVSTTPINTYTPPIVESVPLTAAPLIPTPTSTPSGTPIVYVEGIPSCTLNVLIRPATPHEQTMGDVIVGIASWN